MLNGLHSSSKVLPHEQKKAVMPFARSGGGDMGKRKHGQSWGPEEETGGLFAGGGSNVRNLRKRKAERGKEENKV